MINKDDLNLLAQLVYILNHKWWHDLITGEKLERNNGELIMLIISELAEAMEGERKDLMDDKLPHRKMAEVEIADVVIRVLDFAGGRNLVLSRNIPMEGDAIKPEDNRAESLLGIAKLALYMYLHYNNEMPWINPNDYASAIIINCEDYCAAYGYDLWGAVEEKMEYNKHREDHKKEARLAQGGKKF